MTSNIEVRCCLPERCDTVNNVVSFAGHVLRCACNGLHVVRDVMNSFSEFGLCRKDLVENSVDVVDRTGKVVCAASESLADIAVVCSVTHVIVCKILKVVVVGEYVLVEELDDLTACVCKIIDILIYLADKSVNFVDLT